MKYLKTIALTAFLYAISAPAFACFIGPCPSLAPQPLLPQAEILVAGILQFGFAILSGILLVLVARKKSTTIGPAVFVFTLAVIVSSTWTTFHPLDQEWNRNWYISLWEYHGIDLVKYPANIAVAFLLLYAAFDHEKRNLSWKCLALPAYIFAAAIFMSYWHLGIAYVADEYEAVKLFAFFALAPAIFIAAVMTSQMFKKYFLEEKRERTKRGRIQRIQRNT